MSRCCVIGVASGITGMKDIFVVIEHCENINDLRELGSEWLQELRNDEYGLDVNLDVIVADLESWSQGEGAILVARDETDDRILGVFALFAVPSYLGVQKLALEKYWYTREGSHFAGPKLYIEALNWCREHGCTHLIMGASRMASDRHDSICAFLEKTGAKHFETTYIYQLSEET
jgi:lysylphosphatidylglycerol synthetase-like protein (DUF2156 family)